MWKNDYIIVKMPQFIRRGWVEPKSLIVIKNKWSCIVFEHRYDALNCSLGIYIYIYIFVHIYKTFEYNDGFVELPIYII